ncbi:MAG: hypothetical protein ACE5HI_10940 [bacterium]
MFEILNLLKPVVLLVVAFGLTLGLVSGKKLPKMFAMWILGPLLFAIGLSYFKGFLSQASPLQQILIITITVVVAILVGLRFTLGKHIFQGVVADFIYDVLKFVFLLPLRIIRGIAGIFSRRR